MRERNKLLYGVGINDADYVVQPIDVITGKQVFCPFYQKWRDMLTRCYSEKCQERQPTYEGCSVCDEWLTFSIFKAWMEEQDWEGKQLDKDLLNSENKIYSPDTCIFVSSVLNTFVTDCGSAKGDYMIGVYFHKRDRKFVSQCNNPITKKNEHLGYFTSELSAHLTWKARKSELVDLLQQRGYIDDARIYEALKLKYRGKLLC